MLVIFKSLLCNFSILLHRSTRQEEELRCQAYAQPGGPAVFESLIPVVNTKLTTYLRVSAAFITMFRQLNTFKMWRSSTRLVEASALENSVQGDLQGLSSTTLSQSPAGCPRAGCFTSLGLGFLSCHWDGSAHSRDLTRQIKKNFFLKGSLRRVTSVIRFVAYN